VVPPAGCREVLGGVEISLAIAHIYGFNVPYAYINSQGKHFAKLRARAKWHLIDSKWPSLQFLRHPLHKPKFKISRNVTLTPDTARH